MAIQHEKCYTVTSMQVVEAGISPIIIAARQGLNIEHHFTVEYDYQGNMVLFRQLEVIEGTNEQ